MPAARRGPSAQAQRRQTEPRHGLPPARRRHPQVRGESGDRIPAAEADDLATQTEEVRDSLNCGTRVGTCAGRAATIVGTSGADKLRGTKGADVIAAGGGDDRVVGREATISSAAGRERMYCAPAAATTR